MIEDPEHLREFEDEVASRLDLTPEQAFALMDAMWHEAVGLGVLPPEDPLEGIETDIEIARVLNSCLKNCSPESPES